MTLTVAVHILQRIIVSQTVFIICFLLIGQIIGGQNTLYNTAVSFHFHFSHEAEIVMKSWVVVMIRTWIKNIMMCLNNGNEAQYFVDFMLTEFLSSRVSKVKWVHLGLLESLDLRWVFPIMKQNFVITYTLNDNSF